jgi:type II secretory pathway pseudopilin PulG
MRPTLGEDAWTTSARPGFSIFEAVMVLMIVGIVLAALTPGVVRNLEHSRVDRAANAVAAQFYLAQSLAGRQRKPVRVAVSAANKTITITDAVTLTVLSTRYFGTEGDFRLRALTATPATVNVLPNGMSSASILIDVGDPTYQQQVRVTRAGQVRILR